MCAYKYMCACVPSVNTTYRISIYLNSKQLHAIDLQLFRSVFDLTTFFDLIVMRRQTLIDLI